jgi:hypothetical protein
MTDVLRAAEMPVKIVFFLKYGDQLEEMTKVASGDTIGAGHYMGACFADGEWRLYDFKWQWNPKFENYYKGQESGLRDPRHRENHNIRYVPVTNNGIYTPEEPISGENIGCDNVLARLDIAKFAKDFLSKKNRLFDEGF